MKSIGPVLAASCLLCAAAAASDYSPGFVWQRSADWTGGTLDGFGWQSGNPCRDAKGNPAWAAEYAEGPGGLDGGHPWFQGGKSLLGWDSDWFGTKEGLWARANDTNPVVAQTYMVHAISTQDEFLHAPLARWINPTGAAVRVHVTGDLDIFWTGNQHLETPVSADVAIVSESPLFQLVAFGDTFADPSPGDQNVGEKVVPIDLVLDIPKDGSIAVSIHGTTGVVGRWFTMKDQLTITLAEIQDQCAPDMNGDGVLDLFDFLAFVNLFNAGC